MPIPQSHNLQDYFRNYSLSIQDPEAFWFDEGKRIDWIKPYSRAKNTSFDPDNFYIKWYEDGVLNVSTNCLDRHLETQGNKTALIWEGDNPEESKKLTYLELYTQVCRLANAMKGMGLQKGDRVVIYLPMIVEGVIAMLACARLGVVHSVVFGGFSAESLHSRLLDCTPKIIITSNIAYRGSKTLYFKDNVDNALSFGQCDSVAKVVVVKRGECDTISWNNQRDCWYEDFIEGQKTDCNPTPVNAEDPLFILYTSGSTGKPKGILHTSGGYLVYASMTFEHIFNYKSDDVYWCTADIGWITGHSYGVYGPLCSGATVVLYEGVPTYPTPERFWQIIDKYQVTLFYTAPTAIRMLIQLGDDHLKSTKRDSLRILGSVGEPIDPSSWQWYSHRVGKDKCPIVDTWWQTETGGFLITPLPFVTPLKPGSATYPFYGVKPALVNHDGTLVKGEGSGDLVITDSWPGQARSLYLDQKRFIETYFTLYPGMYVTGDGAKRDSDDCYWITGRVDDVLNVAGHRIGTSEIESILNKHEVVIESAVVGWPHSIKGQGIYAYVVINDNDMTPNIETTLIQWVREHIGPIATIDHIHVTSSLPKTRSGKVMRRLLRKIASNELENFGDISTLLDPTIIDILIKGAKKPI